MSLAGLDSESVLKAYETAIAESAGWFLLKYATRADIELFKEGKGGYVEAREAVAEYGEPSPLFGLVMHRRKKILLKYVPEDTSRLLQARLSVHLQSVIEAFAHDDLVSFASATDLTETTLSSVSSLKSSASVKSPPGKKKPLSEILEDGQESVTSLSGPKTGEGDTSLERTSLSHPVANGVTGKKADLSPVRQHLNERPLRTTSLDDSTERPNTAVSTKRSQEEERSLHRPSLDGDRPSTQSTGSTIREPYVPYTFKPKVKLGPRPSVDAGNISRKSGSFTRPISTLPAGVTMPQRKALGFDPPQAQPANSQPFPPNSGRDIDLNALAHVSDLMPPSSQGSPAVSPSQSNFSEPNSPTNPAVSMEKQRLMKALQKRKKHQEARKATSENSQDDKVSATAKNDAASPEKNEAQATPRDKSSNETQAPNSAEQAEALSLEPRQSIEINDVVLERAENNYSNLSSISPEPKGAVEVNDNVERLAAQETNPADRSEVNTRFESLRHNQNTNGRADERGSLREAQDTGAKTSDADVVSESLVLERQSGKMEEIRTVFTKKEKPEAVVGLVDNEQEATFVETGQMAEPPGVTPATDTETFSTQSEPADEEDVALPIQRHEIPGTPNETRNKKPTNEANSPTAPTITPADLQEDNRKSYLLEQSPTRSNSSAERKKRPDPIEPPKIDTSDAASLSGDSLYEELQSATVEEAKPIIVSRSPATPVFPLSRRSSENSRLGRGNSTPVDKDAPPMPEMSPELKKTISASSPTKTTDDSQSLRSETQSLRSVSNPVDGVSSTFGERSGSSVANRFPSRTASVSTTMSVERSSSKKTGVSSLISSRIKAFENISSSSSTSQQKLNRPVVTPSFVTQRKTSLTTPPSSSGTDASRRETKPYPTPSPSPHNFVMRTFGARKAPSPTPTTGSKKSETHSPPSKLQKSPERPKLERAQDSQTSLASSVVSSPPAMQTEAPSSSTSSFFSKSSKKAKSKRGSVSSISSAVLETLSSPSRNSFSSKRSTTSRRSSGDTIRAPGSPMGPPVDGKSMKSTSEKKESKKSKLLKRMSSMSFSPRNKSTSLSPTLNDQPITEAVEPSSKKWSPMILGEVNVQFPDTLLWKRRHLEIDSHGYLILSPSKIDKSSKVTTKRFHISDFRRPYLPDQDREELPFSVILDFNESSTLQCACEHTEGQHEVLKILVDCFSAFTSKDR